MAKPILPALAVMLGLAVALPVNASETPKPASHGWSFNGIFGEFDRASLQRGFQVYKEVCASCHSIRLVSYRNLAALGYSEKEIKAIAAEYEVTDGPNDEGEMFQRKAKPSERFVKPFPNDQAPRAANNGALPPDLSLMTKARPHGTDYVYALMTGYEDAPKGVKVPEGTYYNSAFRGGLIAMLPPLSKDAVTYADGTPATVERLAEDVTTFLAWVAEPEMEERKQLGIKVMLFLLVFTGLLYALKRKIWADLH